MIGSTWGALRGVRSQGGDLFMAACGVAVILFTAWFFVDMYFGFHGMAWLACHTFGC